MENPAAWKVLISAFSAAFSSLLMLYVISTVDRKSVV